MAGKLEGKIALVTGAAGGIGMASAKRLAADGATVVLADIDLVGTEAVAADIEGSAAYKVDLTNEAEVKSLCERVAARFGQIDILHNNAAIQNDAQRQADLDVVNLDVAAWDMAMAVNVRKQNVRSNCMVIGFVLTPMAVESTPDIVKEILLSHHLTPELGQPEDIANLVAFLASDESKFITGAAIPIDGGVTAHQPSYADFQKMFAAMGSGKL